jgi:hypothetical protein
MATLPDRLRRILLLAACAAGSWDCTDAQEANHSMVCRDGGGASSASAAVEHLLSAADASDLEAACSVVVPGWRLTRGDLVDLMAQLSSPVSVTELVGDQMGSRHVVLVSGDGNFALSFSVDQLPTEYYVLVGDPPVDSPSTRPGEVDQTSNAERPDG